MTTLLLLQSRCLVWLQIAGVILSCCILGNDENFPQWNDLLYVDI